MSTHLDPLQRPDCQNSRLDLHSPRLAVAYYAVAWVGVVEWMYWCVDALVCRWVGEGGWVGGSMGTYVSDLAW